MNRDVAPAWIVANFVSMAVAGVLMVLAFLLRGALGLSGGEGGPAGKAILIAFEIAAGLVYMALYARMTGTVLRRIVPDLPQRAWLAVHLAVGVVGGAALGVLMLEPDSDDPIDWADGDFLTLLAVLAFCGVLLGAVFGGVQAAVLRRAAHGALFWIGLSAVAMGAVAFAAIAVLPFQAPRPTLASEVLNAILFSLVGILMAVTMLPALRGLRPRG